MRKSLLVIGSGNNLLIERASQNSKIEVCFLNDLKEVEIFLESNKFEKLIVLVSLGSWEGELAIELAKKAKIKLAFFCISRTGSIQEIIASREQAKELISNVEFEGVILSDEMPFETKLTALKILLEA
ncbi:MAG: hypothetical protein QXN34_04190 [Archaeoglobaceae archaeon]